MLKLTKKADYGLMALKFLAEHPETAALEREGYCRRLRDSGAVAGEDSAAADQDGTAASRTPE